jgi:DNA-binding transcriptional regulator YdaS (Cro superfamily)
VELGDYLESEDLTLAQFGKRIGQVEESTVARWRDGVLFPSPKNMQAIEAATDGMVTYRDFQKTRDRRNVA